MNIINGMTNKKKRDHPLKNQLISIAASFFARVKAT